MTNATNKQFLTRTGVLLPAGSTTQAPLTFQQSSPTGNNLLSTISAGSIEWDGYNFYVTEASTNTTYGLNSYTSNTTTMTVVTGFFTGTANNVVTVNAVTSQPVRQQIAYKNSTILPPITKYRAAGLAIYKLDSTQQSVIVNGTPTLFDHLNYVYGYSTATQIYTDIAHINDTDDPESYTTITAYRAQKFAQAAAGVIMPPCVPGRKVTVMNDTPSALQIYPMARVTKTGATSNGTIFTLNSGETTNGLYPGMKIFSITGSGNGAIDVNASNRIVSILSTTQFVVDTLPTTAFTVNASVYSSLNFNTLSPQINGDSSFLSIQKQSMEFVADPDGVNWIMTGSAKISSTNGPATSNITMYSVLYANGVDPAGVTPVSTTTSTGSVLISGGSNSAPKYGQVNLSSGNNMITGILPPENGGTGSAGTTLSAASNTTVYSIMPSDTIVKVLNIGLGVPNIFIGNTASSSNVTINGNLIVKGVQETVQSTTSVYTDSVLELQKAASGGWMTSDPLVDVGLRYHEFNENNIPFFQIAGSAGASNTLILSDPIVLPVGSVVKVYMASAIGGITSTSPYAVSSSGSTTTINNVSYNQTVLTNASATALPSTFKTGYLTRVTNFTFTAITTSVISPATATTSAYVTATLSYNTTTYPGIFAVGDIITINGTSIATSVNNYNGSWKITSVSSGTLAVKIENTDTNKLPDGSGVVASGVAGTVYIDDHYAFTGWDNSSSNFYFYKESLETTTSGAGTGTVTGIYGNVKGSTFVSRPSGILPASDISTGMSIRVDPYTVIVDQTTAFNTVLPQASTVRIAQMTLDSYTTSASFTNAASLYIDNSPKATGGITITNAYAIQVGAGNVLFGGNLRVDGGTLTANMSSAGTFYLLNNSSVTGLSVGTSSVKTVIGAPNATVEIGTTGGTGSTLSLAAQSANTVTISANTANTASVFDDSNVSTGSLFANATSINVAKSTAVANSLDVKFGNNVTAGTTITVGGSAGSGKENKITLGGGAGSLATIDSNTAATVSLFPSNTSSVSIGSIVPTLRLQTGLTGNTSTYIGTQVSQTATTAVYIGKSDTSGTSAIYLGAKNDGTTTTGKAILDATTATANGYIFPTITSGNVYYSDNAANSYFGNSNVSSVTLTIGGNATVNTNLIVGSSSATGTNSIKIASKTTGAVKITTDVTTGSATIFDTVSGLTTIGATTISTGNGNVMLGKSPNQIANGKEVVTAEWVLNAPGAINTISKTVTSPTPTVIDITGATAPGAFLFDKYRAAKYVIQATQIAGNPTSGISNFRSQSSELLVTHDAPVVTYNLTSNNTGTSTITVTSPTLNGLLLGMKVSVLSAAQTTDAIPANTFIVASTGTNITLSSNVTVATNCVILAKMDKPYDTGPLGTNINAAAGTQIQFNNNVSSSAGVVYPGMVMTFVPPQAPATILVTSVTSLGFTLSNTITGVTRMTGNPQVFSTEYGVVETNGTVAIYNADVNASSPYEILISATAVTTSGTTLVQNLYRIEKELIEIM